MRNFVALLVFVLIAHTTISTAATDTLSTFNRRSQYHYFRVPLLKEQAARFEPSNSGQISKISVILGGYSSHGSARLRIFGNEAGSPVPFLEHDLTKPITLQKTKMGAQLIDVVLNSPVNINTHQFFVAVDELSEGVTLISDTDRKPPKCSEQDEEFGSQCLKIGDRWWTARHGFAIDVVFDRNPEFAGGGLVDVTEEVGVVDSAARNNSIAWADINNDNYLDLLVGGRLFQNNHGNSFNDISSSIGLSGHPRANLFMDVNNDSRMDIVFLGSSDTTKYESPVLFLATANGDFQRKELPNLRIVDPTSFSVADADNDGYLDLFVGQGYDPSGVPLPNLLLVNDRNGGFVDRSSILYPSGQTPRGSQGSQWVDINSDGFPDLFVIGEGENGGELWRNNADGTFSMLYGPKGAAPNQIHSVNGLGCHWGDYNGDGHPDLLLAEHAGLATLAGQTANVETVLEANGAADFGLKEVPVDVMGIDFSELRGGGTWGDMDNDGMLDILMTSGGACRYVDLYTGTPSGAFDLKTAEYGLLHLSAGPDAVLVDYNNDGLLDMATIVGNHFRLFKNASIRANNYIAIDVPAAFATGTSIQAYVGEHKYGSEISSGRGILMQDPLRLHIGIGASSSIDSLVIRWPNGRSEIVPSVSINALTKFSPNTTTEEHSRSTLTNVGAFPNPFNDKVEFVYELHSRQSVSIQIYDEKGELVKQFDNEVQSPGLHNLTWPGRDEKGEKLSPGTYLYRINAGTEQTTRKIVLVK